MGHTWGSILAVWDRIGLGGAGDLAGNVGVHLLAGLKFLKDKLLMSCPSEQFVRCVEW